MADASSETSASLAKKDQAPDDTPESDDNSGHLASCAFCDDASIGWATVEDGAAIAT